MRRAARCARPWTALGVGSVELSQASVFKTPDAQELERVLAAILEPAREGLLRAALATELMGLDATDIEALAKDEAGMLERIARFAAYRDRWLRQGPGRMLRELMVQEQVSQRMLARADGERRLTNLRHLAECLHEASQEHGTPEALLRWLRQQRAQDIAEDATQLRLESDRNLVQIVTIHKAKGLEYPIVFCPFLWDGHPGPAGDLIGLEYHDDDGKPVIDFRGRRRPRRQAEDGVGARRREPAADLRGADAGGAPLLPGGGLVHGGAIQLDQGMHARPRQLAGRGARARSESNGLPTASTPSQIDAAWARLAQENAPAIAIADLPQGPGQPVILPARPPRNWPHANRHAVIPPAWRIGSYSSLAHGARSENAAADHDVRVPRSSPREPRTQRALPPTTSCVSRAVRAPASACMRCSSRSTSPMPPTGRK